MKEFVDFFSDQSPYDALDVADLQRLVRGIDVEYVHAGDEIVAENAPPVDHLWVVRTGLVEVLDRGLVIDQLGQGDTFGHVSLFSGRASHLSVRAVENTLLYVLPDPRTTLQQPDRLRFRRYGAGHRSPLIAPGVADPDAGPVGRFARPVTWCTEETTVQEAAQRLTEAGTSCALVHTDAGVAIVTDSDFRKALADGIGADTPVARLARRPVLSVAEDAPVAAAFVRMVEHDVHHLVLTSASGRPTGVVRVVDVTSADVRNPLVIRAAVRAAETVEQLREAASMLPATTVDLVRTGLSATRIASLVAAVAESIVRRLVELDRAWTSADPPASLLLLGSLARREFLPFTAIDTALVWSLPAGPASPDASSPGPALRTHAAAVLTGLEACGLRCTPAGGDRGAGPSAADPRFAWSASEWRTVTAGWAGDAATATLLAELVVDGRPLSAPAVGRALRNELTPTVRSRPFLESQLRSVLSVRPPIGFVGNAVVEHSGEHRDSLDLEGRVLRPLVALGQWIALATGAGIRSTPERFRRGVAAGLLTVDEADTLIGSHAEILTLCLRRQVDAIESGTPLSRQLDPATLDSFTRRHLRESFGGIGAVQSVLAAAGISRLPAALS